MKKYFKRAVESDCKQLFDWTNEEEVRRNSFNSNEITFEEHKKWFKNKLDSDTCFLYLFYMNESPVGQVRVDIVDEEGIISYSIDKKYRGKGLAIEMLKLLETEIYIQNINVKNLIGFVKIENIASQKIFEKLQYSKQIVDNNLKYCKYI